jgi:hypothetical protein
VRIVDAVLHVVARAEVLAAGPDDEQPQRGIALEAIDCLAERAFDGLVHGVELVGTVDGEAHHGAVRLDQSLESAHGGRMGIHGPRCYALLRRAART